MRYTTTYDSQRKSSEIIVYDDSEQIIEKYTQIDKFTFDKYIYNAEKELFVKVINDDPFYIALRSIGEFINDKDIDKLLLNIEPANSIYLQHESYYLYTNTLSYVFFPHPHSWIIDAYLYIGDYESAWNYKYPNLDISISEGKIVGFKKFLTLEEIYNLKMQIPNYVIDNSIILQMQGVNRSKLTKFGTKNFSIISEMLNIELHNFYLEHNEDILTNILKPYIQEHPSSLVYKDLFYYNSTITIEWYEFPYHIETKIISLINDLIRNLENDLRHEMGLPNIGEGWLAEAELYYLVKKTFPNEVIIRHGRPKWLNRQHFDIYFPEINIAIEYQGKQHFEPVEYFGGEKAFKQRIQLDKKKYNLAVKNSCKVIYVKEGYDLDDIVLNINMLINII